MTSNKVSICLPTYRNETTIEDSLASILSQTYPNIEILIRDDCSPDQTVARIEAMISKQPNCTLFRNEQNLGIVKNWNRCLDDFQGELVCVFHADDWYDPKIVQKEVECFEKHPEVGVVFTAGLLVNQETNTKDRSRLPDPLCGDTPYGFQELLPAFLMHGNFLICSSAMFRREVFQKVGSFDEGYTLGQDLEMWLRISFNGWKVAILDEPLMHYCLSVEQTSAKYHRGRTRLSEQFSVLDRVLSETADVLSLPAEVVELYRHRRARDLLKCAVRSLSVDDLKTSELQLRESMPDLKSLKLKSISYLMLAAIKLHLTAVVNPLLNTLSKN